jgi:Methylase of chemotaxis methyl-accepting proteins
VNAVTINETAFFRHPSQFEALEDTILPELVRLHQQERSGPMRLWSAACSAGDEAYSLAILIRETIEPRHPRMDYEIVGTDIDTACWRRPARAATENGPSGTCRRPTCATF